MPFFVGKIKCSILLFTVYLQLNSKILPKNKFKIWLKLRVLFHKSLVQL
jgi:hypothetical protein